MNFLVFLQNAWSPLYAGGTWPRASWLRALEKSRSGQRLRHFVDDFDVCHNTTPLVGAHPVDKLSPDEKHILGILTSCEADAIVACGEQAEKALVELWGGPLLAIPHPAYRVATNDVFKAAAVWLSHGQGRIAIRQERGGLRYEALLTKAETEAYDALRNFVKRNGADALKKLAQKGR